MAGPEFTTNEECINQGLDIDLHQSCPHSLVLSVYPTYVSIVSSFLSCFGAAAIVITYLLFKELRTSTRSIITYLAIADFITALGYLVGGINYLIIYHRHKTPVDNNCLVFEKVCVLQSYVTTWSQLTSFLWNSFLALFLYVTIVYGKHRIGNCFVTWFHLFAWTLPIAVALPLLVKERLGFSILAAANWCFIKDQNHLALTLSLAAGRVPEIICYGILITFYSLTRCFLRQRMKHATGGSYLTSTIKRIDQRLLVIPLAFVLLRIWGTIQFFLTIYISYEHHGFCIPDGLYYFRLILAFMEAIGNGGQGWANALIFIFFNSRTRALIIAKTMDTFPLILRCCRRRRYHQALITISDSSIKYGSINSNTITDLPNVSEDTDDKLVF